MTCSIPRFVSEASLSAIEPTANFLLIHWNLNLSIWILHVQLYQSYLPGHISVLYVRLLTGTEAPMWPLEPDAGQGTFPLITLALSSSFLWGQPLNISWHQIKVGDTEPYPFSQSLGTFVFGATTPPASSSDSDLIGLMSTLGCNGGFQRQYVHCTVPCWNLRLSTGCDTHWEDMGFLQWFPSDRK